MAWYESVPQLAAKVVRLAWLNRKESPFIKVQGGVNARLAKTKVVPRSVWSTLGKRERELLGFDARFSQFDFDQDIHYFVVITVAHPGTSDWPAPCPRMKFPFPPYLMDAWVAKSLAQAKEDIFAQR
jgi:hypothetical protein